MSSDASPPPAMTLTARQLNRATLQRQSLLNRSQVGIVDAVRNAVALQAQEPPSPYVALWNRVAPFRPADVTSALLEARLVKASLMRITLHIVAADDYTTFHEAMIPTLRSSRLNDRRFSTTGLTVEQADALVPPLIQLLATTRTRAEIEALIEEEIGVSPDQHVWWALRTYAPLLHAPIEDPWSFGRIPVYRAAPESPPRPTPEEAIGELFLRYLSGFGPASTRDFAQFALLRQSNIKPAVSLVRDRVIEVEGPDGPLYDLPGRDVPPHDAPAPPRLMAMWDSVLLAYSDRSRVIPDDYRPQVIRRNGDVLPTILVDGYVCGVWRPLEGGIEVSAFDELGEEALIGLDSEARGFLEAFGDRAESIYGRYSRWWADLPTVARHFFG